MLVKLAPYRSEVEETPCNDCVIVESNIERDHSRCNTNSSQRGRDPIPGSDRTLPQSLTDCQLKEEDWKSFDEKHDPVWNKESAYKWKEIQK